MQDFVGAGLAAEREGIGNGNCPNQDAGGRTHTQEACCALRANAIGRAGKGMFGYLGRGERNQAAGYFNIQ